MRGLWLALLVVGVILLVWGIWSADSLKSQASEFFSGHPSGTSMWLIVGGVVAAIIGFVGSMRGTSTRSRVDTHVDETDRPL